jgi:hypothetical protein
MNRFQVPSGIASSERTRKMLSSLRLHATGAKLKLEPWDGDVFIAKLMPTGRFAPIGDLDYMISGFIDGQRRQAEPAAPLLRWRQPYEFRRR